MAKTKHIKRIRVRRFAIWVFEKLLHLFLLGHRFLYTCIVELAVGLAKFVGRAAFRIHMVAPFLAAWASVVTLIFGGCCSNVFALETIIKAAPSSGLLITFVQFIVVTLFTWPAHFSSRHPPFFLKPLAIPLRQWIPSIVMFFVVNLLNNLAFGYNISVPVHIILRSGGSILTMVVGYVWGKRYTKIQVFSVSMLTVGIIIAAMADAQAKGKMSSSETKVTFDTEVLAGLALLFIAQLISAIMGLYVQLTYAKYGSHWAEYLFYSHLLSIPMFLPFGPSLLQQFQELRVAATPATNNHLAGRQNLGTTHGASSFAISDAAASLLSALLNPIALSSSTKFPPYMLALAVNALTQYACIRGVNTLAAHTSALGVTIVLNVRKLASLFISIWLFGNRLPPGVAAGAAVVFASAGLWAWEGQRTARREREERRDKGKKKQ